jgi:hypothetical protein
MNENIDYSAIAGIGLRGFDLLFLLRHHRAPNGIERNEISKGSLRSLVTSSPQDCYKSSELSQTTWKYCTAVTSQSNLAMTNDEQEFITLCCSIPPSSCYVGDVKIQNSTRIAFGKGRQIQIQFDVDKNV